MTEMNDDTDYVHTAVINFEPTYLALMDICNRWMDDQTNGIADYRDELAAEVERWTSDASFGLSYIDAIADDVDYAVMIQWEVSGA